MSTRERVAIRQAGMQASDSSPFPPSFETEDLERRFGPAVALHPLSIRVGQLGGPGSIVGLIGPNGSGKSTFMRVLTGLVRPDAGRASVEGVELRGDGTAVRARVTYSPGELHLYGEKRGAAHLRWLLRGREPAALARARSLALGFTLPLDRRVREYSSGMKRMLVLSAALAPRVGLRILDEPTAGLDPERRGAVLALLTEETARGTTVLLSSHHLGEVDRACERILFMNAGRIVADERASDVQHRARRLVRLTWRDEAEARAAEARIAGPGVEALRRSGARLSVVLADPDPRGFLAALADRRDVPAPLALEYGQLSLGELYRDVYGVEAT